MPNPLLTSINRAVKDDRELARLFASVLGTAVHPRGQILTIYRSGRKAMATALGETNRAAAANGILANMRAQIVTTANEGMSTAVAIGQESAAVQVAAYNAAGVTVRPANLRPGVTALVNPVLSAFDAQTTAVRTLLATNASAEAIIGDETRLGVLQPAPIQREASRWLAAAVSEGFSWYLAPPDGLGALPFRRQAIAAVDERTTPCCLSVHGQVVGLDQDFELTGTPRYADHLRDPPFHDYCRTSIALYLAEFDDGYTAMMREAAILEARLRELGNYTAPHPANAFTRIMP